MLSRAIDASGSATSFLFSPFRTGQSDALLGRAVEKGECMAMLNWKLLTKKRGSSTQGLPPGKENLAWVTNTVTLIYGERDAVLVDTFLSVQHSKELVDWVAESGKNLIAIYVTHAHGDHFFGLKLLLDRFPNASAFATASSVAGMQNQIDPDFIKSFWEPRFPGQVPSQLTAPRSSKGIHSSLKEKSCESSPLAIPTRQIQLRCTSLRLGWSCRAMLSTTTRIPTSPSAMKRPGTSGFARSIKSRLCIRKR